MLGIWILSCRLFFNQLTHGCVKLPLATLSTDPPSSRMANQPTLLLTPKLLNALLKRRTTKFTTPKFLILYMCKLMPRTVNLSIARLLRALLLACLRDLLGGSARDRSKTQDTQVFSTSPSFFKGKKYSITPVSM